MSNLQRGLGRGLDALFGDTAAKPEAAAPAATLPLSDIVPNPGQPRRHFAKEALEELAASVRSQGIIQPLLVRPKRGTTKYEIVAGERRWRAAGLAGLTDVPVLIRDLSDEEVMLAALIENLQREDLNPIEEALALKSLREHCNLTQEELAERLGKSRSAIANALRLLSLSPEAQEDLQMGRMNAGHARALLSISNAAAQEELRCAIVDRALTVRDAETAASMWKDGAAFPWEGAPPMPEAASAPAPQPQSKGGARRKSPALKILQQQLGAHLAIKTSISGNEERGRITLNYSTPQELAHILGQLGMAAGAQGSPDEA